MQLKAALEAARVPASLCNGDTPIHERHIALESPIILSTWSMAREGLDVSSLDTLVMATPKSDVEQAIGRIQRSKDTEKQLLVIDIFDGKSPLTTHENRRRLYYKEMGYKVTYS